jgi:hypothetical protein
MLSTEECREHLGRKDLTDTQVNSLRDVLYGFVENLVDEYIDDTVSITTSCKKQLSTAEFPLTDKRMRVMD